MDHVVYLDAKSKELERLINGTKTMIVRGAAGRKLPHGRVNVGDVLWFIENNADGMVKAYAVVKSVFNSEKLTVEESAKVISEQQCKLQLTDLNNDYFTILEGETYYERLIPRLKHYWLPLKGKTLLQWVPALHALIDMESSKSKIDTLHRLFNCLPRLDWTMINSLQYENGIYIMFEKGERYQGMDRIIRIGTHRGKDRLKERLRNHFIRENADSSIFRKNIGRAFLNIECDPYLSVWNLDTNRPEVMAANAGVIDSAKETMLETRISSYLRENVSFACFRVDTEDERLRLEEGMISELNQNPGFGPGENWLGLHSSEARISSSGLWNVQGLDGTPISEDELEKIKQLVQFGTSTDVLKNKRCRESSTPNLDGCNATLGGKKTADDVRRFMDETFIKAKAEGKKNIELVSGQIHKTLGMNNRMPQICRIMYEKMKSGDEVIFSTPSGKSSTIKIRYYLE